LDISENSFDVAQGAAAHDITLTLTAGTRGAISGTLTIESNDPNSPTEVNITANAQAPQITVSPDPINFGGVTVGVAAQQTVSIGNDGNLDLNVTDITSDLGTILDISETSFDIAPGADAHPITLTLTASTAGAISGKVIITSNDQGSPTKIDITANAQNPPEVSFSSATYTVDEAGGNATITVTLSAASADTVTVYYATSDGTATAGSDYTSVSDTLTFNPSDTTKTFDVPILDDALDEPDETVNLTLSNPVNANLTTPATSVITITDNDLTPEVTFSSAIYTVDEFTPNVTITVTLSAASAYTVTVYYATSDGTATAGSDYTGVSDTLTFNPGDIIKTFDVPILDDALDEPDETVSLMLLNPVNATLSTPATAVVTIADDDLASVPEITVSPDPIDFGDVIVGEPAQKTVSIGNTGNADLNVTDINYSLADGALVISEKTFTVAPGSVTYDITLTLTASASGAIRGILIITSNDPNSPTEVNISASAQSSPSITSVIPSSRTVGATDQTIVITGSNFQDRLDVAFEGLGEIVIGTTKTTRTDGVTQITLNNVDFTNAAAGDGSIRVTNPDAGTATAAFTVEEVPQITVSPDLIDFGDVIVGEASQKNVSIGNAGDAALNVTNITSDLGGILDISETAFTVAQGATREITLTLTPSTPGQIDGTLTITSNALNSPTNIGFLAFVPPPPTITAISPTSGATAGGTAITITGENFVDGATVTIGGNDATDVTFVSATQLTAKAPAGSAGNANVVVRNPGGQSETLAAGFTYVPLASSIAVKADPDSLVADGASTSTITVTLKDASGNPVSIENVTITAATGNVGEVKNNNDGAYTTIYTAPTKTGKATITAKTDISQISATTEITLNPGPVARLTISPSEATVTSGETLQFSGTGVDANDNPVSSIKVSWEVVGGMGTIDENGLFTAIKADTGKIKATADSVSQLTGEIIVTPGPLAKLTILPDKATVISSEKLQFSVLGVDANDNSVALTQIFWEVIGEIGAIDENGLFTAIKAGTGKIKATADAITDESGDVSVASGPLAKLTVLPSEATVTSSETQQFSITGVDANDNPVVLTDTSWEVVGEIGAIDENGLFTAIKAGTGKIKATVDAITGESGDVVVTPGPLAKLTVSPSEATVTSGETLQFSSTGVDANDNPVSPTKISWEVVGGIGTIDENGLFTAIKAGTGKIKVTVGSVSIESGEITVTSGGLAKLIISPSEATVTSGETLQFSVAGEDANGNPVTPEEIVWSVLGDIGTINADGLFTATAIGVGQIEASAEGITVQSRDITVADDIPPIISIISPKPDAEIGSALPEIVAKYSDADAGINLSAIVLQFDGIDVTPDATIEASQIRYTPSEDLTTGTHTITFIVADQAGNQATAEWSFSRLRAVSVSIPEISAFPGDSVTVPVEADDATGIAGGELTVLYDASLLRIVDAKLTDLTKGFSLVSNLEVEGRATISIVNATGVETGSGGMIELVVEIDRTAPFNTEIPLTLDTVNLWTESAVAFQTGLKSGKVVILDGVPPKASLTINDGAKYTDSPTVTLTLSASDAESGMGDGAQMQFSNDNATWSNLEPYAETKEWTLPQGDGEKTVYFKCQDVAGNPMPEATKASIVLDEAAPTGTLTIEGGAAWTRQSEVSLTISADDETSGLAQMRFRNDNENWSEPESNATTKSWSLPRGDGEKTVYAQCQDVAGNWSGVMSATIGLDETAPGTEISLSGTLGGNNWYISTVTVTLKANDATSGVDETKYKIDGGAWNNYSSPFEITADGTHTVEYYSKDKAGNEESSKSETVKLDTIPPEVAETTPKKAKKHAPINAEISINFGEDINPDSVNPENIKVIGEKSGPMTGKFTLEGHAVLFTPDRIFADKEKVTVTINTGIQDTVGNPLPNQFIFSFTTGISVRPGDANNDGTVNIRDIVPLGRYWGKTGEARQEAEIAWDIYPAVPWENEAATYADTDGDGMVNAQDVIPIGENWQLSVEILAAPVAEDAEIEGMITLRRYSEMLEALERVPIVTEGIRDLKQALKRLISQKWAQLIPETELLQNYPNPFNPETWIPYQLAQDSEVIISIYDQKGQLVRLINLGVKAVGMYFTKDRATYWDGRNDVGEKVASGLYYYKLKTDNFSAVRRMLIVK